MSTMSDRDLGMLGRNIIETTLFMVKYGDFKFDITKDNELSPISNQQSNSPPQSHVISTILQADTKRIDDEIRELLALIP